MRIPGFPTLAIAVVSASLSGGCSGDRSSDAITVSGARLQANTNGALIEDPRPLTLRDLRREPSRSARRAVLERWFDMQWGNIGAAAGSYDVTTRRLVGTRMLDRASAVLGASMLIERPRIVAVRRTDERALVILDAYRRGLAPMPELTLMRRKAGRWKVLYDTLLERALQYYGAFSIATTPDTRPSTAVLEAGAEAAARLRARYPVARTLWARRVAERN